MTDELRSVSESAYKSAFERNFRGKVKTFQFDREGSKYKWVSVQTAYDVFNSALSYKPQESLLDMTDH